ncbi:MAG: STAS/SEC14 domain-containing protein [Methanomicrobiales archaeon HGW-Methanomicrobiales-5]|nr:MAG: STAS/SEC14 domain-containing protein [Methanomicrobiales archaeon HGW-Methanomicrobiales-5]
MITLLPESSGNVIGFLIQGKLADEDYQQGLIPPLEEAIKAHQKIRLLFQMDNFGGWTAHGAWDDFINWPKFMSVERMAVVVDQNWHEFMTWLFQIASALTHMEIRFFRTTEMAEAWAWLQAP